MSQEPTYANDYVEGLQKVAKAMAHELDEADRLLPFESKALADYYQFEQDNSND